MKVLIVSHNVFSVTESMGKTLASYFKGIELNRIAQFYIHSEVPTSNICTNYYRVTDKEMIKSLYGKKTGKIFLSENIEIGRKTSRTDEGADAKLYQKARKRSPLIYFARNLWWKLGKWDSNALKGWLNEFNPDCVFFASGDYSFIYDIALNIAESRRIPLYISCMDDYYINNKNKNKVGGDFQYRSFMKHVRRAMEYATSLFCICDKMSIDYRKMFNKPCYTLHTSASFDTPFQKEKKQKISYIGNLGLKRDLQLIDIGRAVKELNYEINHIDVYSSEKRPEILKKLTIENGIIFHGGISADSVKEVMAESLAVVHTESFDEEIRKITRYSVSTKIADSLMSGTCILAYGPKEIASMQYLYEKKAAFCAFTKEELESNLKDLLFNEEKRKEIIMNALDLAKANHLQENNRTLLQSVILEEYK